MADTFQWTTPGNGTFDVASNWTDETNPGNVAVPGSQDTANLVGPGSGPAQIIAGPGNVATLNVSGLSTLAGDITSGLTRVDSLTAATILDVQATFSATLGLIVGNAGSGALVVGSGGTLTASSGSGTNQAVVGSAAGSSGTITVAAGGTLLLDGPLTTINYGLVVGNSGSGSLIITGAGAAVEDVNQDGVVIGYAKGSAGSLVISNGGSASFGTSNSENLAAVAVGRAGAGTLTVDGAGSTLSADGLVFIGRAAAGTLLVDNSGVLTQTNSAVGIEIGVGSSLNNNHVGGTGTGTVTSGGTLSSADTVRIGGYGVDGALTVSGGGVVSAATQISLGNAATIDGTFETGSGSLEVDAGGFVRVTGPASTSTAGLLVGGSRGANGSVLVTGSDATIDTGANLINIGNSGTGSLSVTVGGTVIGATPGAGDAAIVLGNGAAGVGTLSVQGIGSSVTADGALTAGYMGQGTLNLGGFADVTASAVFLGGSGGGSGVAIVSGGSDLISTGTLAVGEATSAGTLSLLGGLVSAANIGVGIAGAVTLDTGTLLSTGVLAVEAGGSIVGQGTIDATITAPGSIIASGGSLTLTGAVSGGGLLDIASGGDLVLDSAVAAGTPVNFSTGSGERLDILAPGSFEATVGNFGSGDVIFAQGAASVVTNGSPTVTLFNSNDQQIGTINLLTGVAAGALNDSGGLISYACFAAGTRIATPHGAVAVEALRAGDPVRTAAGAIARVQWLGHRHVDCDRHPRPADVWPVRIRPGAFGPDRPARDLWLSPDHAVFVAGCLIPVRYLLNGRTIAQERRSGVTYFHVELARHDILLAEGLPCESYLDTGNRGAFANGGVTVRMLPDFAREVWQARGCAPLVLDGAVVVAAQRDLLRRAGELGFTTTDDPGLRVLADDRVMTAVALGRRWHVRLPAAARTLCLSSLVWIPAHARPGDSDTRPLGVAIGRLWLNRREASLESPALRSGWHPSEAGWRWTDGNGELDATGVSELAFDVAMTGTYSLHPSLAMRESGMESAFIASPARRRRLGRRAG